MGKVILFIASSADNYIAGEDGSIDWLFHDADYNYKKFFAGVGTVIMGRKTFELSKTFAQNPYPGKKIVVFTRKKGNSDRDAEFSDDPVQAVKKLKEQEAMNIWLVGGCEINSILLENDLIDELILSVHPIILGKGIPLFKGAKQAKMELKRMQEFGSGLVQLHYVFNKI